MIKAKNIGLLTETIFSNFLFRTRKYCFKLCLALETGFSVPRQHLFQKSRNHRGKLMKQSSILELLRSIYKKRKKYPWLNTQTSRQKPKSFGWHQKKMNCIASMVSRKIRIPLVYPLAPMIDQERISPYNINTISTRQVMRIKKNINLGIIHSKFSELTL